MMPSEGGHWNITIEIEKNVNKNEWNYIMRKKLTIEEFIGKAKLIQDDKYDYSSSIYKSSIIKIDIICSLHANFYKLQTNI